MADTHFLPHESDPNRTSPTLSPASETPHVGTELKEEGVFSSLISSFRDVFFPAKLPPLVLESKPIYVADPMAAAKMSRSSIAGSIAFYGLLILLIAVLAARHIALVPKPTALATIDVPPPPPPIAPKAEKIGGGGGQKSPTPVTQGHPPKFAPEQLLPPKAPPLIPAKLPVDPTVNVQLDMKMPSKMPDMGMPNSNLKGFSMGNGNGSGIGSGSGDGMGAGSGGNTGGGPMHIGGSVRPPSVLYSVEPEFSEEARKAKFSGNVQVYLWVDEQGNPSHVKVVRGVGMGLDEKAVDAVRQYKFKPAMQNGKPVKVDLYIDVNFQIF
jgi:periplasmic protein TonB